MWPNNIAALAWMPLVVLAVERAWQEGGRRIVLAALVGATQMLAGAPEIILLTWLVLAAMCVAQGWRRTIPWRPALARFALIAALVFGLTAIQTFPFLDLLAHAHHARTAGKEYWAMPIWGWANFLVPLFHCSPSIIGAVYSQADQQWTSSYYLGIGPVALALLAAWRVRKARVAFLAGIVLVGLILALGENGFVFGWLKCAVPAAGFLRYPIKFVVLTLFALPLLAAFGLVWLQRRPPANDAQPRRSLIFVGVPLLLLIAGIVGWANWFPLPDDSWRATWQSGATRGALLVMIVATLLGFIHVRSARGRGLLGLAVLALIGVDALTHAPRQNPTVPVRAYGPLELNLSSRLKTGESRAMISPPMQLFLGNAATPNSLNYYLGARGALYANCNLLEDIPKVNGFYSLYLNEEAEVRALIYNATNAPPEPLADFLGVSRISASDMPSFAWRERPTSMPLVTAGQRPLFARAPETLKALASADFDPRGVVYLPPEASKFISASNAATAKAALRDFTAHKLSVEVEASAPAIIVVAQVFYPSWQAFVDGKPVRLWRANHAFQALEVPAGRHEVKLVYEDRLFYVGMVISTVTLAGCTLVWFRHRKAAAAQTGRHGLAASLVNALTILIFASLAASMTFTI
jgi:hypothetical protein